VLYAERIGQGSPVTLVHGFTQTGRSWLPVVDRLRDLHTFTVVDAPGHGRSAEVAAGLWAGAGELGEVGGRGAYAGYSLGGRLCLHLALARPELVDALVLVGATAGIESEHERSERRAADEVLAQQIESDGVARFVERWLQGPLFSTLSADAAGLDERLTNTAAGLAASLRLAGTGTQEPLWDRVGGLDMPVLVVAGELDDKFAAIGRRLSGAIGRNAELVLIPGAGHACHLERPDAFCLTLADFLADASRAPAGDGADQAERPH
jgi:2-succinyl-6-hydroxy-2,4-cyclohexadiene-1-carboxylate synthase